MNVTLPDDASIQIVVVPHGAAPLPPTNASAAPVLLAEPRRKSSRRRDAVFLTIGACMCAAVLGVVRTQHTTSRIIDPAHAAVSSSRDGLAALPSSEPGQGHERAELATAAPPVDPTEAVRRLLDQRPTVTPPPGGPSPAAVVSVPGATPGATPAASRNAFGMTD